MAETNPASIREAVDRAATAQRDVIEAARKAAAEAKPGNQPGSPETVTRADRKG